MTIAYPCIYCCKSVRKNQKAILCVKCSKWSHLKCGNVTDDIFLSTEDWICNKCYINELPFYIEESPQKHISFISEEVSSGNLDLGTPFYPEEKGIKIAHLNVRSLRNKTDDIQLFLNSNPYDIFSMSETWLDNEFPSGYLHINGYNLERKDRASGGGGGVGCYIKTNILYKRRHDLEDNSLELMWIEIQIKNHKPYILGIVYRPPKSTIDEFEALECNFENVCTLTNNILITGDMNCNMLTDNILSQKVTQMCDSLQLQQLVSKPTRITPHSETLIDLFFVSQTLGSLSCGVQSIGISDHSLIYVCLKAKKVKSCPKISIMRSFRNFDSEKFLDDLSSVNWDLIFSNKESVNTMWLDFKEKFIEFVTNTRPM